MNIYPVTIVTERYGGTYSAPWLAFNAHPHEEIVQYAHAGDGEMLNFWYEESEENALVGRGTTPQEAYEDLLLRLNSSSPTAR